MKSSEKCHELIKSFESFKAKAYFCPAGVPTIGWGTTRGITAEDVRSGRTVTRAAAHKLFMNDIRIAEAAIEKHIKTELTQGQFDALVSLVHNAGTAPLVGTIGKLINKGDLDRVPAQWMRWVRAAGKELPGLVRRRREELGLWRGLIKVSEVDEVVEEPIEGPVVPAPPKPMMTSNTVRGSAISLVGGASIVGATVREVSEAASPVHSVLSSGSLTAIIALASVVVLGAGYVLWVRFRDREMHL